MGGFRALERADVLMEACERAFVEALPADERDRLAGMLERLLASNR